MNHVTGDMEMETLYWILDGMDVVFTPNGSESGLFLMSYKELTSETCFLQNKLYELNMQV